MRISPFILALLISACANTSVVIPVSGPVSIRIKTGDDNECKPVIVNGEPQPGCASELDAGLNQ